MQDNIKTYIELGGFAMKDPSIIKNHLQHDIHIRLAKKVQENLDLIAEIGDDPDFLDLISTLNRECLESKPILEFYLDAL